MTIYGQVRSLRRRRLAWILCTFKRRNCVKIFSLVAFFILLVYLAKGHSLKESNEVVNHSEWSVIDRRPSPSWYDRSKIGIFVHWGVYSVPGFASEWSWWYWKVNGSKTIDDYMRSNYKPNFSYQEHGPMFTAEFFNPEQWADLFQAAGAKYVVLTSKHHDGYTLWPSSYTPNWNSMVVGPKRDLVGDLAKAVRARKNMRFGLYYSLMEWFHPLYMQDKENNWTTRNYVNTKMAPEMLELVNTYQPEVLWSDGDWETPAEYWNSTGFLNWLYNESPVKETVVTNDRWGEGTRMQHGGFYSGPDRFNPRKLQERKWENCFTLDLHSWGYRKTTRLDSIISIEKVITIVVESVSCGGNILINVGPTPDGRIIPIFEERLRQLGSWLQVNGEAIYESTPWTSQNDTLTEGVWYTQREDLKSIYAIVLHWPTNNVLHLGSLKPTQSTTIQMLGVKGSLPWSESNDRALQVPFPLLTPNQDPSKWGWVLKITGH